MKRGLNMAEKHRFLLLAGTNEARRIADELAKNPNYHVSLSYAGRTDLNVIKEHYKQYANITLHCGGFGGTDGLREFIKTNQIQAVIDATHPFATTITKNALQACNDLKCPLFLFQRKVWLSAGYEGWHEFAHIHDLMQALPGNTRPFLTVGQDAVHYITHRPELAYVTRSIMLADFSNLSKTSNITPVMAPPASDWRDEADLMKRHSITHLVTKNSGGEGSYAKIQAAMELGITIFLLQPSKPLSLDENSLIYSTDNRDVMIEKIRSCF